MRWEGTVEGVGGGDGGQAVGGQTWGGVVRLGRRAILGERLSSGDASGGVSSFWGEFLVANGAKFGGELWWRMGLMVANFWGTTRMTPAWAQGE